MLRKLQNSYDAVMVRAKYEESRLEKVLVVGGYGVTGGYVVKELLRSSNKKILIAGREIQKAEAMCKRDVRLSALKLDIYDQATYHIPPSVSVVVMCVTPQNNAFAIHCIQQGIHYIDISPSPNVTMQLEELDALAIERGVTCVLGVGIAPGLSTLLANALINDADSVSGIKLSLMLGLGDKHGADGVKWMLDNLQSPFAITKDGTAMQVKPFMKRMSTPFPKVVGKRSAFLFPLSDAHILTRMHHPDHIATYFTYNSRPITHVVHWLKRLGVFGGLRWQKVYKMYDSLFKFSLKLMEKFYNDAYAIYVQADYAKKDQMISKQACIYGRNNPIITGSIAAYVAGALLTKEYPKGVYYMGELFELDEIYNKFTELFHVEMYT